MKMNPLRYSAPSRRHFVALLILCAAASSMSCSVLIDRAREQCATDQDCQKHGAAFAGSMCVDAVCRPDPTWSCIGSVTWPTPATTMATVTLNVQDLIAEKPISNVTARLCRKLDITCEKPIQQNLRADGAGVLTLELPTGFDGYAELVSPTMIP